MRVEFSEKIYCTGSGTICIVDDSETDLFVARRSFNRSKLKVDFQWLEFMDGSSFLKFLFEEVETNKVPVPSLILLDINMPGLNGFEVLKAVRQKPAFAKIPVFMMLTNSQNKDDLDRAKSEGASGYKNKPFSTSDYISFFDSLLMPTSA